MRELLKTLQEIKKQVSFKNYSRIDKHIVKSLPYNELVKFEHKLKQFSPYIRKIIEGKLGKERQKRYGSLHDELIDEFEKELEPIKVETGSFDAFQFAKYDAKLSEKENTTINRLLKSYYMKIKPSKDWIKDRDLSKPAKRILEILGSGVEEQILQETGVDTHFISTIYSQLDVERLIFTGFVDERWSNIQDLERNHVPIVDELKKIYADHKKHVVKELGKELGTLKRIATEQESQQLEKWEKASKNIFEELILSVESKLMMITNNVRDLSNQFRPYRQKKDTLPDFRKTAVAITPNGDYLLTQLDKIFMKTTLVEKSQIKEFRKWLILARLKEAEENLEYAILKPTLLEMNQKSHENMAKMPFSKSGYEKLIKEMAAAKLVELINKEWYESIYEKKLGEIVRKARKIKEEIENLLTYTAFTKYHPFLNILLSQLSSIRSRLGRRVYVPFSEEDLPHVEYSYQKLLHQPYTEREGSYSTFIYRPSFSTGGYRFEAYIKRGFTKFVPEYFQFYESMKGILQPSLSGASPNEYPIKTIRANVTTSYDRVTGKRMKELNVSTNGTFPLITQKKLKKEIKAFQLQIWEKSKWNHDDLMSLVWRFRNYRSYDYMSLRFAFSTLLENPEKYLTTTTIYHDPEQMKALLGGLLNGTKIFVYALFPYVFDIDLVQLEKDIISFKDQVILENSKLLSPIEKRLMRNPK